MVSTLHHSNARRHSTIPGGTAARRRRRRAGVDCGVFGGSRASLLAMSCLGAAACSATRPPTRPLPVSATPTAQVRWDGAMTIVDSAGRRLVFTGPIVRVVDGRADTQDSVNAAAVSSRCLALAEGAPLVRAGLASDEPYTI